MDKQLYRELGTSGIRVSPLAMGCWAYGGGAYWGEQSQRDVDEVVARALDMGLNMFDTAEMYNAGASETSLGLALSGRRQEAVVCSKVGPDNAYYDELIAHCEDSLKRLRTDYIDVYMLHWPLNRRSVAHFTKDERKIAVPPTIGEAMAALDSLKKEGKIRAIGLSNFGTLQMGEAVATGVKVDVNEITYNILSRAIEESIVPYCLENRISIVASMTLQQGLLAGIYNSPGEVPSQQAHSRHFSQARGGKDSRHGGEGHEELLFDTLRALNGIADSINQPIARLAIAWVLKKPGIAAALVGSRNADQLEDNLSALSLTLSDETVEKIDAASQALLDSMGMSPDYYESGENCRIW